MSKRTSQLGFTITELLVAIIVGTILSGAIMGFMTDELKQSTISLAKAGLLHDAEVGLDTVANDIRLSSNADDNNRWQDANAPVASSPYSWQSNSTTLILATAAIDTSGNILWQDANNYIPYKNNVIYFLKNGTLYKRILAADIAGNSAVTSCPSASVTASCPADRVMLQNVSSFSVAYHDGNGTNVTPSSARSVVLTVTLSKTEYNQALTATYTTQMVFRND